MKLFCIEQKNISRENIPRAFSKNSKIPNVKQQNGTFNLLARGGKTYLNGPSTDSNIEHTRKTYYDRIIKLYDGRVSYNK